MFCDMPDPQVPDDVSRGNAHSKCVLIFGTHLGRDIATFGHELAATKFVPRTTKRLGGCAACNTFDGFS
jgi:hypothetical protein